jgi:hypothetical protein
MIGNPICYGLYMLPSYSKGARCFRSNLSRNRSGLRRLQASLFRSRRQWRTSPTRSCASPPSVGSGAPRPHKTAVAGQSSPRTSSTKLCATSRLSMAASTWLPSVATGTPPCTKAYPTLCPSCVWRSQTVCSSPSSPAPRY